MLLTAVATCVAVGMAAATRKVHVHRRKLRAIARKAEQLNVISNDVRIANAISLADEYDHAGHDGDGTHSGGEGISDQD